MGIAPADPDVRVGLGSSRVTLGPVLATLPGVGPKTRRKIPAEPADATAFVNDANSPPTPAIPATRNDGPPTIPG